MKTLESTLPTIEKWTKQAVFNALAQILPQVAPLKVEGIITTPQTSLSEDLAFDSLDIMELLSAVNDRFCITLDFELWIGLESNTADTPFTLASLSEFILESLKGEF